MNNLLLLILVICVATRINAQAQKVNYMAVPVISQNSVYLKNASKGTGLKESGQTLRIDLPANTVEWYYTITTKPGHAQFSNNDLTGQLVKLVDPEFGILKNSAPSVPPGTGICDVYLMTSPLEAFKFASNRPATGFLMNDSRKRIVSGIVPVRDYSDGPCFLVIRNSNIHGDVSVNIEVTAIVLSSSMESSTAMQ